MPGGNGNGHGYNPLKDKVLWVLTIVCGLGTLAAFGRLDDVLVYLAAIWVTVFVP